jgi:Transcription factor WhiB
VEGLSQSTLAVCFDPLLPSVQRLLARRADYQEAELSIVPAAHDGLAQPPTESVQRKGAQWEEVIQRARCSRPAVDPDWWFPLSDLSVVARREAAAAIAICRLCPVRIQCLELSIRHWDVGRHGIWGGLLAVERAELRRLFLADDGQSSKWRPDIAS